MERRLTARGRDRRRQLMDFAATRFAASGYHATSVAEVVQGVGVGKGVFYWYFPSKEELFAEILRDAQADLRHAQRAAIDTETEPVRRIELGIRSSIEWLDGHRDLAGLFAFAASEARFAPLLREAQELTVDLLTEQVKHGIVDGSIRDADPVLLAQAVLGVLTQLTRVFLPANRATASEVADAAVAFCLSGLLATSR